MDETRYSTLSCLCLSGGYHGDTNAILISIDVQLAGEKSLMQVPCSLKGVWIAESISCKFYSRSVKPKEGETKGSALQKHFSSGTAGCLTAEPKADGWKFFPLKIAGRLLCDKALLSARNPVSRCSDIIKCLQNPFVLGRFAAACWENLCRTPSGVFEDSSWRE